VEVPVELLHGLGLGVVQVVADDHEVGGERIAFSRTTIASSSVL
jgi:hypothetical protein